MPLPISLPAPSGVPTAVTFRSAGGRPVRQPGHKLSLFEALGWTTIFSGVGVWVISPWQLLTGLNQQIGHKPVSSVHRQLTYVGVKWVIEMSGIHQTYMVYPIPRFSEGVHHQNWGSMAGNSFAWIDSTDFTRVSRGWYSINICSHWGTGLRAKTDVKYHVPTKNVANVIKCPGKFIYGLYELHYRDGVSHSLIRIRIWCFHRKMRDV